MQTTHNNPRHTAETNEAVAQAAAEHGAAAGVFLHVFDAATELLDATHAVYDTPEHRADGIDPTEQTRFEIEERGDDVLADALQDAGVDGWADDAAYEAMVDAIAAACEAWQPLPSDSKHAIRVAKQRVWAVALQPNRPAKPHTVAKVRDGFVWLRGEDGNTWRANSTASDAILRGTFPQWTDAC